MAARRLLRISLLCTSIGLLAVYALSLQVEPQGISINMLDRHVGDMVRISGTVTYLRTHEEGHLFLTVRDESGQCEVPVFSEVASKLPRIFIGEKIEVTGSVEEYRGSLQVVPPLSRDVKLLGADVTPTRVAEQFPGRVVVLQGIAVNISSSGRQFTLADQTGFIRVESGQGHGIRPLTNMTISGRIKTAGHGNYLRMLDLIEAHPAKLPPIDPLQNQSFRGLGVAKGRVAFRNSSASIVCARGFVLLGSGEGLADGDLVTAVVRGDGDKLSVMEVEVNKANIFPIKKLSDELLGTRVRVRGVVIRKYVSGNNVFLTLYNETDLDLPLFGAGDDVNVTLGDLVTALGVVKKYRDRLQVVPNSVSDISVEPGEIAERKIDQISDADLYQLVRIHGRVTSVKHYRKSCSVWIRDGSGRIRVYAPFGISNVSVGMEIEAVGLVKRFNGQLELIPRDPSDFG